MAPYKDFLPERRFWPGLQLSPEGDRVAYVDDASGQFNLAVQPVAGGPARQLNSFPDRRVWTVRWHPNGNELLVTADRDGDEKHDLFFVDAETGASRALTADPKAQFNLGYGMPFSPDGSRLAYGGNDVLPQHQDVLVSDAESGETVRLLTESGFTFPGYWSPDGHWLTAAQMRDSATDHVLYLLPTAGGQPRVLSREDQRATYAPGPWLPDGSAFFVRSHAGREFTGLATVDPQTGALTWWETPEHDIESVALAANGRILVWLVNVDGASQLRARDLATGELLATPALPVGQVLAMDISADGQLVAMQLTTPTRPTNVVIADLSSGQLRWLTDVSAPATASITFVEPELVHYPAPEGRHVPAFLYRPSGGTPRGVVMSLHGGPTVQERPTYQAFYQYLLHHGLAVLAPNVGGSTGYGKSYLERIYRDWGGRDLADFVAGAQWLRGQSWVDPARIALYGGSYGGFAVLSCVARRPELEWAAAVDVCGISNLLTLARTTPPTWRTRVAAIIGDPEADEEFLRERSPVNYTEQIRAPLFILQGANDPRVPQHESDQVVERLRERGVPVRYDVYPDEGHGFAKRENRIRADTDAAEFLISHLSS